MADRESTRRIIVVLVTCVRRRLEKRVRIAASSYAVEDDSGPRSGESE